MKVGSYRNYELAKKYCGLQEKDTLNTGTYQFWSNRSKIVFLTCIFDVFKIWLWKSDNGRWYRCEEEQCKDLKL